MATKTENTEDKPKETLPAIKTGGELTALEAPAGSVFGDATAFALAQRVATMLSQSQLVPKEFQNNIPNSMIALEMASRVGASPLMVMQNLYIVHGKPAWASQFLIATLNASGRFSPIDYEEDEKDGGRCRAFAVDKTTGQIKYGIWVSIKMADAEQWIDKNGSKWKTMPALMLRYRAATFFVRQFAPEISMGIMTAEEQFDVGPAHKATPSSRLTITERAEAVDTVQAKTVKTVKQPEPNCTPADAPDGEF